jgi:hypothetical protein
MLTTVAMRTWVTAPADAFAVAPSSGAACLAWRMTPSAPAASTDRRIAPTFCGSSMLSSTTSSAGPGASPTSSSTV